MCRRTQVDDEDCTIRARRKWRQRRCSERMARDERAKLQERFAVPQPQLWEPNVLSATRMLETMKTRVPRPTTLLFTDH